MGKVEYDIERQKELLNHLLGPIQQILAAEPLVGQALAGSNVFDEHEVQRKHLHGILRKFDVELATSAYSLMIARAFLKDPVFREEQEWRIMTMQSPYDSKEQYRVSNGLLIPYRSIDLDQPPARFPITRVLVGPSLHPEQARNSLRRFLKNDKLEPYVWDVEALSMPIRI